MVQIDIAVVTYVVVEALDWGQKTSFNERCDGVEDICAVATVISSSTAYDWTALLVTVPMNLMVTIC